MKTRPALKRSTAALRMRLTTALCLALAAMATVPGCSGCFKNNPLTRRQREEEEEEKKRKPEKPKKDFEFGQLKVQPSGFTSGMPSVKPGHWITASQQIKANNFDFPGRLVARATDRYGRPIDVTDSSYYLSTTRPAALPKGQLKHFETTFFVPRAVLREGEAVFLQSRLESNRGGRQQASTMTPTRAIPDHRYLLVVLSTNPDRYRYLKLLDSIAPESGDTLAGDPLIYYDVALPKNDRRVELPSHPLTWSQVAFVLWDDLDPQQLTPDQQQAMLDWLHWGGQLIVSGPGSLHLLQQKKPAGSFLEALLPAINQGLAVTLDQSQFDEINAHWSLREKGSDRRRTLQVVADAPPVGIRLSKHSKAEFLPHTGGLLAERRIGRGRIVVTAFSLSDRQVINWRSFDGFFNACLLRRPRRRFSESPATLGVQTTWSDHRGLEKDARLVSTLRYFTRDVGHAVSLSASSDVMVEPPWERAALPEDELEFAYGNAYAYIDIETDEDETPRRVTLSQMDPPGDVWHFGGYRPWAQAGVAGWNDGSGASTAAREALLEAAGITIPPPDFVFKALAIYLVVLVPVNWGVFRLLRRVEWAWIAAPVIAVVGALVVIRAAQLDIGFARSRTEIVVLEGYGGYDRGHATRYTALYNSLSTDYQMIFDDPYALAQPFSMGSKKQSRVSQRSTMVSLRRDRDIRLSGFRVASNFTGMMHSEHMVDLGKGFRLTGDAQQEQGLSVENGTPLALRDVVVLRRDDTGRVELAWVGPLAEGAAAPLRFSPAPGNMPRPDQWDESAVMSSLDAQVERLMNRQDANRDGSLSDSEVETLKQSPPRAWDGNRDGRWSRGELRDWLRAERAGQFSLGALADLASQRLLLANGEVRLIGWSDQPPAGLTVRPSAAQLNVRTLVLIHLRSGRLNAPRVDENCRADVVVENDGDALDLFSEPENQ